MPNDETVTSDSRPPILAVDLDGTIINEKTEELIPGAKDALLGLRKKGWKIIVWTARGDAETYVPKLLERLGVPYDAVNDNLPGIGDKSRKIYFDAVVDNKNVDFHDGWESVARQLEDRRVGWQNKGITKVNVCQMNPITGDAQVVQTWGLDKDGRAVMLKSTASVDFEKSLDSEGTAPEHGEEFLKSLLRTVNGTYVWAERVG